MNSLQSINETLLGQGKLDEAVAAYRAVIERQPDSPEAHHFLAIALHRQGRLDDAIAAYRRVTELGPGFAETHSNLGLALMAQGRHDKAAAACRQAIALRPDFVEAHNYLGIALQRCGKLAEAVGAYRAAIALRPNFPEVFSNLCVALHVLGQFDEAVAAGRRAVALRPGFAEAHNNLGYALEAQGRPAEAITAYRRAIELAPGYAQAYNNLGNALQSQGRLDEAVASYREALRVDPNHATAHSNLLLCLNARAEQDPAAMFSEHRKWGERFGTPATAAAGRHGNDPDPDRRLRIGYVSPDLRIHSVAFFFEPLIAAHDRDAVEAFCYSSAVRPDAVTERLRRLADGWREIGAMNDADVAEQVRADGIDILVDLAGHMAGNLLTMFAHKPAPVQVSYIGYPNTTGLDAVNYRLTDALADPQGQESYYCETLVRLPRCFLCYAPPDDAPAVAPPPEAKAGSVTFGSFNHLRKVTPEVIAMWSRILVAVPAARLVLKAKPLAEAATRDRFYALFERNGIERHRIEFLGWDPSLGGHLDLYGRVDIALDPFPYNGTTTTCEALWMGVPVVTLEGCAHAGRVGVSLLTAVGLGDLVAHSPDDYVAKVAALANDPARRTDLRGRLRGMMAASPLCDAAGLARSIEAAYRDMWRRWCAGR
jgi:predicted O-linked N-acetylglucosamine transferase (SPINDLY family)